MGDAEGLRFVRVIPGFSCAVGAVRNVNASDFAAHVWSLLRPDAGCQAPAESVPWRCGATRSGRSATPNEVPVLAAITNSLRSSRQVRRCCRVAVNSFFRLAWRIVHRCQASDSDVIGVVTVSHCSIPWSMKRRTRSARSQEVGIMLRRQSP